MKKQVVLGVSSGIAAYKSVELVKLLKKEGIEVSAIMTASAAKMVDPGEFKNAGAKVYSELFEKDFDYKQILKIRKVDHIDLADSADVFVVAPATANVIAKIANGIADDFLTTALLAASSPIILCPSMNVHMWTNPITQSNIQTLQKLGFIIIPPESGMLACGYEGPGRLPHLKIIKDEILNHLGYAKSLIGKKVLITAGGTIEKIDDVRQITNKSSGKMGIAIAEDAYLRGADVLLLRSKTSVSPRYHVKEILFETADELSELLQSAVKDFDIIFHVAAVSDFTVSNAQAGKISSDKAVAFQLVPQVKIISQIKMWNPKIFLVGFKAEAMTKEDDLIGEAKDKLQETNADMIVANDISRSDRGFYADTNEVFVVTEKTTKKVSLRQKKEVAREILEQLLILLPENLQANNR